MTPYVVILFVHIAAATMLVGASVLATPLLHGAARHTRSAHELGVLLRVSKPLMMVSPVSAVIVLVSGIYLTSVAHFWNLGWVQVATVAWIVNAVVAGAFVKPAVQRIAGAFARAGGVIDESVDAARGSVRWTIGSDVLAANDAAVVYLMVVRPSLSGSVLAVVAANAIVLAGRWYAGRRRPKVAQIAERDRVPAGGGR